MPDERKLVSTKPAAAQSALWLIAVLSWVPDDKAAIAFVENYQMTETLFEAAIDAHNRGCDEVAAEASGMLLSWMFKAGRHETGWAIFERACYGLATLEVVQEKDRAALLAAISDRLAKTNAPDQTIRDRAAREIRERAETLDRDGYRFSGIERSMSQVDDTKLQPLLGEIANRLSPGTANEPIHPHVF